MKKLLVTLAAVLVSVATFAQGTINFNNRGISGPNGTTYNAPVLGDTTGAVAQLFLVTGSGAAATYTPVAGQAAFRTGANAAYFVESVLATVPGQAPGTTGLNFVVRAWKGASYDAAVEKGESNMFTVGALGGENPAGGLPFLPPDLGGPNGVGGIAAEGFRVVPEPSTIALGLLGAAALLYRRRK